MNTSEIALQIRSYIRDEILSGQDEGLTDTTPLLELGILDSFALIKLLAAVNDLYSIEIRPEEVGGKDFKDIQSIAALVTRHCKTSVRSEHPSDFKTPEGVASFEEPSCAQVFIIFSGLGLQGLTGDKPEFFNWAHLENRNIIVLHDTNSRGYCDGVSSDLPSSAKICEWLQQWILKRAHIVDVYCIGVSAGGPIAMVAGTYLRAKTVWAFAPRTTQRDVFGDIWQNLGCFLEKATGKKFEELARDMTEADEQNIDAQITPEIVNAYYSSLNDPQKLLDFEQLNTVVNALSPGNGVTEHRVYYVKRDEFDSRIVESLLRCPNVTVIPVQPSDEPPPKWAFSRWVHPIAWVLRDHLVVKLLRDRNEFGKLFPPFRPAAAIEKAPLQRLGLPARG